MIALNNAQRLWDDHTQCLDMVQMWETSKEKIDHEQLIASGAGDCGSLVDLGCGTGRFASVMQYSSYSGYDGSHIMISLARQNAGDLMNVEFSLADIFEFQSGIVYDTLIMVDVAQHQEDPIESIFRVLNLWTANTYIVSLLVGAERQELSYSNVISLDDVLKMLSVRRAKETYLEPIAKENFGWLLMVFEND